MASRVVFRPGAVQTFVTTLARKDVRKTSIEIKNAAKRSVAQSRTKTGALRASIGYDIQTAGYNVRSRVGSPLDYAIYVHEGTDPHVIRSHRGNLYFFWQKRGVWFRGPKVNHPGQKRWPFLTGPMQIIAERRGYAVRIYR